MWTCPSCGLVESADANFCRRCGEQRLGTAHAGAAWRRWWHSVRLLLVRPGQLTLDHIDGRRRQAVPPLSLFLSINLVFFVVQGLSGLNVLSIPLRAHLEGQSYSPLARAVVERRLAATGLARERFADRFEAAEQPLAKASVITTVPLFALAAAAVVPRRARRYRSLLVFALHFYAFLMLFMAIFFPAFALALSSARALGVSMSLRMLDDVATAIEVAAIAGYLGLALPRAFAIGALRTSVAVVALTVTVGVLLYLQRIAVLAVTAWSV